MDKVGTRGYYNTDFKESATLSGMVLNIPIHSFKPINVLIVRSDFVNFSYEYLAYKFDIPKPADYVLEWSKENKFKDKIYRPTISDDYQATYKILCNLALNFLKSDTKKVEY